LGTAAYPATAAQREFWFIDQHEHTGAAYSVSKVFRLIGHLDQSRLAAALDAVLNRHEALRTTFAQTGKGVEAVVNGTSTGVLSVVDFCQLAPEVADLAAMKAIDDMLHSPLELSRGPIFVARLFRTSPESAYLALAMHHIAVDAWSEQLVLRDISTAYNDGKLAAPELSGGEAARRLQCAEASRPAEHRAAHADYWRAALAGAPALLDLPGNPRPARPTHDGARLSFRFPDRDADGIHGACRRLRVTPFVLLLTAFGVTLGKVCNQGDVVVGVPVMHRDDDDLEDVVGPFVNSLPIRIDMRHAQTLEDVVQGVRDAVIDAMTYRHISFDDLVRAVNPERVPGVNPIFQCMLWMNNVPGRALQLGDVTVQPITPPVRTAKFDLTLDVRQSSRSFDATLEYSTALLPAATAERLRDRFFLVLRCLLGESGTPLSNVAVGTREETELVASWSGSGDALPGEHIVDIVRRTVAENPHPTAVVAGRDELSYDQLWRFASSIAADLSAGGVRAGSVVATCLSRGAGSVAAPLAIWLCGATYLPLDTRYPAKRIQWLLDDAGADTVLVDEATAELGTWSGRRAVLVSQGSPGAAVRAPDSVDSSHPAYLIYTSGSTGTPKGVLVDHAPLVNVLREVIRVAALRPADVVLAATTVTFDISLVELLAPLVLGARCVVASDDQAADPRALAELCDGAGVTCVQATPGVWQAMSGRLTRPLRVALCGGEQMPPAVRDILLARSETAVNLYGPTETTIWSSAWPVGPGPVRAGSPLAGNRFLILDQWLAPVPVNTIGELYICGGALAVGYHGRPDLTARSFIAAPDQPGGRMYRTGDRARWTDEGALELLGRTDDQVKVAGHRIELGEVERCLAAAPGVASCAVVVAPAAYGGTLAAFVVPQSTEPVEAAVESHARAHLPPYMVPSRVLTLDALPFTGNAKLDRAELARLAATPGPAATAGQRPLPVDLLESIVVEQFHRVLELPTVDPETNFFRSGGSSLAGAILLGALSDQLHTPLRLAELYQRPTPRGLVQLIRERVARPVLATLLDQTASPTSDTDLSRGQEE
jgi:amino acid adenylation domain-containing protein